MDGKKIIECIPNFSEGKSKSIINQITNQIEIVEEVKLLDVDMGYDTNRTVVTFAGPPNRVIEAAFNAIKKASELIDMRHHNGAHLRMGATDVCPIVPVSNITMRECIELSKKLGNKIAKKLNIPVFLYEESASNLIRKNLANIRSGEYEGMSKKLKQKEWAPDFGPKEINEKSGVIAVGAREFLIAYNVNLNTKDKKKANDIALDIREKGRAKRDINGKIIRDANHKIIKIPGKLKNVKAVGWYINEYKQAQVSLNLTNYKVTSIHKAFEEVRKQANKRGLRVSGSEIIGLVPKEAILLSGKYYLKKQKSSIAIPEKDIIEAAVCSLGLNDIAVFKYKSSIIEEALLDKDKELIAMFSLGLSIKEIKLPIIIITFIFMSIYIFLNLFVSPYVYKEYKEKEFKIKNEINIDDINLSNFLEIENIILDFKKDNNEFKEIFINYKEKKENIIYAKKGKIINEDGKIIFNLFNGFKLSFIDEENEKLEFENYKLEFLLNSLPTYKIFDKNSQTILNLIEEKNYSMMVEKFFDFLVLLIVIYLFYKFNIKGNNYKLNSIFVFLFVSLLINIFHNIIKNIDLDFQLLFFLNTTNIAINILLINLGQKITNE